jgi:SAM-dependent methyltransferase
MIPLPRRWSPECWTPAYGACRIRQWWYEKTHPDWPWLTPVANRFLQKHLQGGEQVLEFGSGGSTLFFARRVASVVSFETSERWAGNIRRRLKQAGVLDRVSLRLQSAPPEHTHFPHQAFDGILIDGGDRLAAAESSLNWLKPGGWLVLDDVHRYLPNASPGPGALRQWQEGNGVHARWRAWWQQVQTWPGCWTCNGVTDTLLLQRPGGSVPTPEDWRTVDLLGGG